MKWPPYLMKFSLKNSQHAFGFWLPICLIWPIGLAFLLAAFLIMLPFAFLAALFTWNLGWLQPLIKGFPAIIGVLCSLPGLTVEIDGREDHVHILFR